MTVRMRPAGLGDADGIARLHADSWRRHYRGAYADSFLDGDVTADRLVVWTARLNDTRGTATVVAEDGADLVGFVHLAIDDDACWGSLVDNLHVVASRQRGGIGTALLARAARMVTRYAAGGGMYLWVLEQNDAAQRFYEASGARRAERAFVGAPGGVPGQLDGTPAKLRMVWSDVTTLAARA